MFKLHIYALVNVNAAPRSLREMNKKVLKLRTKEK
jgi:hypothetical protein